MTNKTFSTFDKYDLEPFADQLTKYLTIESQFVEGSFVLSLNSEFGSGKTTFLEMWQEKLKEEKSANVVLLNSWQSDFHGDALLAIVSGLLESIGTKGNEGTKKSIKENAGKLSKFAFSIGNDIVTKVTGIDFKKAGEYAESENSNKNENLGQACFEVYHQRQEIFNELKSQLTELTKSEGPIIVIIDELDRCKPTYAIEFLETIKHFFDINGLIFVLGVDKGQLASSAKALFGIDLNFDEYYRKFAHRNVSLPVKSKKISQEFCKKLINEYFSIDSFQNKERFPYINHTQERTEEIIVICNSYSCTARQIHELFRIAAHAFSTMSEIQGRLRGGFQAGTFFMIAISFKDELLYHKIGRKSVLANEFTNHLKKYNVLKNDFIQSNWLASLLYSGVFGVNSFKEIEKEFVDLGIEQQQSQQDNRTFEERLKGFSSEAYGRFFDFEESVFSKIYETLEGLKTFAGS